LPSVGCACAAREKGHTVTAAVLALTVGGDHVPLLACSYNYMHPGRADTILRGGRMAPQKDMMSGNEAKMYG